MPADVLHHGDLYKLIVHWNGGCGERIPTWATQVVQDAQTGIFNAQVWDPQTPYVFKTKNFKPATDPLLIYECHIGMAQQEEKVGTYNEFREKILPRVAKAGYNCIQVMAIQEHPYYGSFGYHVSNFFAASSRFGTPDELKELIDAAHALGIAVIMDIVHSHSVKNEVEGLANFAGDPNQYFYPGARRNIRHGIPLCFDYGKNEVIHFLLSNCKYWLEEYSFDGFRFDGVTSMLYFSHGLGEAFVNYADYYNGHQDDNAICYLTLANDLIHQVKVNAITIAEDVSGMPGIAAKIEDGGMDSITAWPWIFLITGFVPLKIKLTRTGNLPAYFGKWPTVAKWKDYFLRWESWPGFGGRQDHHFPSHWCWYVLAHAERWC